MKERSNSYEDYRFGFQGQEQDDEISGDRGTYLAFKYRIHDTRLGKFLSVDPLSSSYPWNSTYAFAENRPIFMLDLEGLEGYGYTKKWQTVVHKAAIKIHNALEYLNNDILCSDCFTGTHDQILQGELSTTQKVVAQASFNTTVGVAGVVIEFIGGFETGGATWAGLVFSLDQTLEGITQFQALYEGSYDNTFVYGPIRRASYKLGEAYKEQTGGRNIGALVFNLAGSIIGGSGAVGSLKKLMTDNSIVITSITVVGSIQGEFSDIAELAEYLEGHDNPEEVFIRVTYESADTIAMPESEGIEIEIDEIEEVDD